MKAYVVVEDKESAHALAESIVSEYEKDPNCGAKPWHIDAAKETLSASYSFSF
jgi:hypothetical protein